MNKLNAITDQKAQKTLPSLIKQVHRSHQPLLITGKQNNVILLSQDDWEALQRQAKPAYSLLHHPLDDSNELPCTD